MEQRQLVPHSRMGTLMYSRVLTVVSYKHLGGSFSSSLHTWTSSIPFNLVKIQAPISYIRQPDSVALHFNDGEIFSGTFLLDFCSEHLEILHTLILHFRILYRALGGGSLIQLSGPPCLLKHMAIEYVHLWTRSAWRATARAACCWTTWSTALLTVFWWNLLEMTI